MKHIKKYIAMALGTVTLSACISDLDTTPLTPTTTLPEVAWSNNGSYEQYTAKIYSAFAIPGSVGPSDGDIEGYDQGEACFVRSYWNLQELPTDESKVAWSDDGLNGLNYIQWTSTNRFVTTNYDRMNLINAYVNEFLNQTTEDKLSARGLSDEKKDSVNVNRAEVRALRALSYYVMMDLYANVPYTDETTGIGAYMPEQVGRDFLFPYIESELKAVIDQLPEKSANNYGKVNRYVADMILANLYMNAEVYGQGNHYNDAITYLEDIINNGGYTLEQTYKYLFGADNNESEEIIFPIIFDGVYAQSYGGTLYLTAGAYGDDMATGTNFGLPQYWSGIRAPKELSGLFDANDRRALFWAENRTQDIENISDFKQGYSVVKFTNLRKDGTAGSDQTFPDTDFPFYRLADAYLLYVEAVMRGGNGSEAKAVSLWNAIQERAFGDSSHNISTLAEIDFKDLIDERARELYWEGHRRTDLIRFQMFINNKNWSWKGGSHSGNVRIDNKYLIYPLPSTDISANSNLQQNPGY